ncbi:MAG: MFS transporter [Acidobacteria bacterium]|nr:MFS transporter [Acidobacteriota bacterium]
MAEGSGVWRSLARSFASWRTAAVTLQSFPSGLPLGLVWVAIPAWLALEGVDIKTIGFVTLTQAPWTFKFLWSPLMDRYAPPFLGRKRGWAVVAQFFLLLGTLALAWAALDPQRLGFVVVAALLVAFASASQDIAIDAYAVEVLHQEEQGVAAGARGAVNRFAVFLSGRVIITLAKFVTWPVLFALQALVYIPAAVLMVFSPEPESVPPPPSSLRAAIWEPFVSFLKQHRALEIALFLVLYKFADNLASALVSPFLIQTGFNEIDVGVAMGTIGLVALMLGTVLGGVVTSAIGLGHSLWIFGFLQAFSNVGYMLVAQAGVNRPLMYAAMGIESATQGMGTGAFSVLLLRLTQKRFSATQYALLSSIFAIGRTIAGPIAGIVVDATGWWWFFLATIFAAIPGLVMLQRFAPLGVRDPEFVVESRPAGGPLRRRELALRALGGIALGATFAALASAALDAMRGLRADPARGFVIADKLEAIVRPSATADWITLAGVLLFGLVCGLAWAALAAARRGIRSA